MTVPRLRAQSSATPAERTVTLLGATGSIGSSTIDLLKRESKHYRVEAVTAHRNASALARIARDIGARFAAVADPESYNELKDALAGSGIECGAGDTALMEAAQRPADWIMAAIVGIQLEGIHALGPYCSVTHRLIPCHIAPRSG